MLCTHSYQQRKRPVSLRTTQLANPSVRMSPRKIREKENGWQVLYVQ
ncbi:hypothetical protein ACHAW6_005409 [Cyclotella cf. meneghiniana]